MIPFEKSQLFIQRLKGTVKTDNNQTRLHKNYTTTENIQDLNSLKFY